MSDEPATVDILHRLVLRVLDGQRSHGADLRDLQHRMIRMERQLHELQQKTLDRSESETDVHERIDAMERRLARLEDR